MRLRILLGAVALVGMGHAQQPQGTLELLPPILDLGAAPGSDPDVFLRFPVLGRITNTGSISFEGILGDAYDHSGTAIPAGGGNSGEPSFHLDSTPEEAGYLAADRPIIGPGESWTGYIFDLYFLPYHPSFEETFTAFVNVRTDVIYNKAFETPMTVNWTSAVPEPGTLLVLGAGAFALAGRRRRP